MQKYFVASVPLHRMLLSFLNIVFHLFAAVAVLLAIVVNLAASKQVARG